MLIGLDRAKSVEQLTYQKRKPGRCGREEMHGADIAVFTAHRTHAVLDGERDIRRFAWRGDYVRIAYALRRALQIEYQIEEREIEVELIGREENENLLFWEAAEGGIGVWERLIAEPREFRKLALRALEILHFDPSSGQALPDWEERCTAACYDCLLSYSNQPDHRYLDRHKVRDFLFALSRSDIAPTTDGPSYNEQYHRLLGLIDPASSFERSFLEYLYKNGLRLPDHAQHTPADGITVQPDFYYERDGIPGVCIFIDGPQHDETAQAERDHTVRESLKDQGFRVVAIKSGRAIADQVSEHLDIFRPQ